MIGECINLGHDQPLTINEVLSQLLQALGKSARIVYSDPRPEDLPTTHADLSKARSLLGYRPAIQFENGIHQFADWYVRTRTNCELAREQMLDRDVMRFIAVQLGARRSYAVPEILERAGMLERFYTDICGTTGLGRAAGWLRCLPGGGPFRRLRARQLPRSIVGKTRTFDIAVLRRLIASGRLNGDPEARFRFQLSQSRRIGHAMIGAGFGNATHIYSMLGEGGPFLAEAKRRGLTVVSEVYILLATESILAQERKLFPGWEPDVPEYGALRRELLPENPLLTCSDFFVCPSDAVRDDLTMNFGIEPSRSVIVPYGVNNEWLKIVPRPIPGRVLFVGTAELRKGIHYLAMAAEKLKSRGYNYEFRIAGNVNRQIARRGECRSLTFLGRVPRDQMCGEFERADIFVLPSLAEGSAEAVYEAMACAVPVVTTAAAGSVVRNNIDGLMVAERDPEALAEAIVQIVEDRELRERMSITARKRARDYTWDRYGERLISALKRFHADGD